jgi:hypothetical protein
MKNFKLFTVLAALTVVAFSAKAQDTRTDNHVITISVPDVALLDLETSAATKDLTADFAAPTEAGDKIGAVANNSTLWLNYSSILPTTVTSRRVDVKASSTVDGVTINVTAGTAAAAGKGTKGTPTVGGVALTAVDQPIISGIGSVYTVSGVSKGHKLTYAISASDANYADLRAGTTSVTVTYTLADN